MDYAVLFYLIIYTLFKIKYIFVNNLFYNLNLIKTFIVKFTESKLVMIIN
jgi:lipid A disaccharide synthetase